MMERDLVLLHKHNRMVRRGNQSTRPALEVMANDPVKFTTCGLQITAFEGMDLLRDWRIAHPSLRLILRKAP